MATYLSAKGAKNVNPYNFMPHETDPRKKEMSLEEYMMANFGGN